MLHQNRETIPSIIQDHREWHHGRTDYSLWLIEFESRKLHRKVEAAREHLSEFLLKPYHRQPHVTLFVCGFLVDTPLLDDDYTAQQLRHQERLLKDANIKPFTIEVGGLNSFSSAPFLKVEDTDNGIARVRAVLSTAAKEIGGSTFTPHVTVGLYSGTFPSDSVMRKLAAFPDDSCMLAVDRITFAVYRAQEMAGELTYRHHVSLRT